MCETLEMFSVSGVCDVSLRELLDLPMCFINILGGREGGRKGGEGECGH